MSTLYGPANRPILDAEPTRGATRRTSPTAAASAGLAELPPFCIATVIRRQAGVDMSSCVYIAPQALTIEGIEWSLRDTDAPGVNRGPIFQLHVDGVSVFTSDRCIVSDGSYTVSISVAAGQRVGVVVADHGEGEAIGLAVMCRLFAVGGGGGPCVPELSIANFLEATDGSGNVIWECDSTGILRDGNVLYVMSRYFGTGRMNGIAIVDISTPTDPVLLSTFDNADNSAMNGPNAAVKDGNYLYVVCRSSDALVILDVSNPAAPQFVGEANGFVTGFPSSPDGLVKDGNYIYTTGSNRGVVTFDVSDPFNPAVVGQNATSPGFDLDDVVKIGDYLYTTNRGGAGHGVSIFNVSTPTAPAYITTFTDALIGTFPLGIVASGSTLFVACPNTARVVALDVSNPVAPVVLGSVQDLTVLDVVAGLVLDGSYLYTAANTHAAVLDVSDPTAMLIVSSVDNPPNLAVVDCGWGITKLGRYVYINAWALAVVDIGCD